MPNVIAINAQASQSIIAAQATSDDMLLESIADGNRTSMHILYCRHNVRVYRFILRIVRDATTAEDLVSQVFLDVWRTAGQFQGRSQVSTWLLSIARFKALTAMRQRRFEDIDQDDVRQIPDDAETPETSLDRNDTSAILRACVQKLSPAHREIINLVYYHEKSVEEVGQIIGIPQSTVKTRMFYARKQLADLLKGCRRRPFRRLSSTDFNGIGPRLRPCPGHGSVTADETIETKHNIRRKNFPPIKLTYGFVKPPKDFQRPGRDAPLRVVLYLGVGCAAAPSPPLRVRQAPLPAFLSEVRPCGLLDSPPRHDRGVESTVPGATPLPPSPASGGGSALARLAIRHAPHQAAAPHEAVTPRNNPRIQPELPS